MQQMVKGRLIDPTHVELDEPVKGPLREVMVVVNSISSREQKPPRSLSEFIRSLPPGTRSREDIDQQIREERESWDR